MNTDIYNHIKSVEQIQLQIPLVHPFRTSFGEQKSTQSIIIKIIDDAGNIGWGETCVSTDPGYCYETTETAFHIQSDFLIPKMQKFFNTGSEYSIYDLLQYWKPVRGHEFAKGGIEAALFSLKAEQEGVSLKEIYGGTKDKIPTGVSIGIQPSTNALISRIGHFLEIGYQRIKIKIEPGWDDEIIAKIRQVYGDIQLMVDANSAYSLSKTDTSVLIKLDEYKLMMIEQPLAYDDILDHRKLQSMLVTPICLDESIHNPRVARNALEFDCCKIINIKPGRVGGFYNAITIAKDAGAGKVWCGGMLENGIGRIHNLCLQSREEFSIPGDTSGSDRYFEQDIIEPHVKVDSDGTIKVPNGKGLGFDVLEDQISKCTTRSSKYNF